MTNNPDKKTWVRNLIVRVLQRLLRAMKPQDVLGTEDSNTELLQACNATARTAPSDAWVAEDDADAQARYDKYKSKDPFPKIEPALLNSADLCDYVAATGMIYPFYPTKKNLKPASYRVSLLGICIFWDGKGKRHEMDLRKGQPFVLHPNSIAFVSLEPRFRIPDYIALRFNLQITHIHRGLLLGTGPLVDPGFDGKLLVPLHNLTTNDYHFRGGDPLIWMEFTKLSKHGSWSKESPENCVQQQGQYFPFEKTGKPMTDVKEFLEKVEPERSIRSSIPTAILSAQQAAERAARNIRNISLVAFAGIFIGVATLLFGAFQILSYVQDVRMELQRIQALEIAVKELKEQKSSANNPPAPTPATGQQQSSREVETSGTESPKQSDGNSKAEPSPTYE